MSELVSMSPRELSRAEVMQQLKAKRITQRQAAEQLGLTIRQVKRLWRAYRSGGAKALVSKHRSRPSNHQLDPKIKKKAHEMSREHYADFGPTLAHEKLREVHHLQLSLETVRHLLIAEHGWRPHRAKPVQTHPLRARRSRRGELVQLDGSPFAWFEDRGPACSVLVYIDDATGQLLELFFAPAETAFSYFAATQRYLTRHGRPVAFYSDKHSIFRLTYSAATTAGGVSQFSRAMTELDIQVICANSPQANAFSEAQFKTVKYHPTFPGRFGAVIEARTWAQQLFHWYNYQHHHTALGLMTPAAVHTGLAPALHQQRQGVLAMAYAAHPERFVCGLPQPPALPAAVWLNPPGPEEKARSDTAELH